jgi:G3E family GTPase
LASARGNARTLQFLGELHPGNASKNDDDLTSYLGARLPPRHDPKITSVSLRFDVPFTWESFSAAMDMIMTLRGQDLLRVKGIVNVEGSPVVVQGVQHVMHPPVTLDQWPSTDTCSRLVFITRGISESTIRALFDAVTALQP